MKILDYECINSMNIKTTDCFLWAEEMIRNKDKAVLPPKTHLNMKGNIFCNVMPSIISVEGHMYGGVKVVTRYPDRIPSLDSKIMLLDMETGEMLALLDGNWITAMRTGAVAAHSIKTFARTGYKEFGMVGLGNTARSTLLILNSLEKNRNIHIKLLRYKDQAEQFIERFREYKNIGFSVVDSVNELVSGSDVIVSCATYFESDICRDECFDEGVLVVPVHTRGFTNCDLFFDKVYADDTGHVDHFGNFDKFRYYAEVSDVVNGRAKGRENDKERILAYNIGISIHDIYFAVKVYNQMLEDREVFNKVQDVNMHEPVSKFWV